ncbi:hypothetical protein [Campylobacter sp. RM16192]|uniref:hypothetical protein n=1 Tax=Campylobacter sp. RM16192 TaxID=1660080 RepID=UPI001451ED47|nr:hypothetical protein [Campylobacter sp. RM16192]QCD51935.1 putative membrane protein [Campylobacter sp. RM16192]
MLLNFKEFSEKNPIKWAIFMGFLSSLPIVAIAFADANIDFNSASQNKETDLLQIIFYFLASYIFIKFFTFLKKFSLFYLILFSLLSTGVCLLSQIYLLKLFFVTNEPHQNIIYALLAGASFLYIFILNLIASNISKH